MKIIVTAGGGGHFAPALAVMKALEKRADVLFVGRKHALEGDSALSLEYQTVRDLSIPFQTITTGRLQRTLSLRSVVSLGKLPLGLWQSLALMRREKPDAVLSFGGYIALPVTIAAFMLRIPVVIHEQTMRAGLANKIAGKFARKICLTFPSSKRYFEAKKTVITGSPLRESFLHPVVKTYFKETLPIIFITGGSLGSHAINSLIEGCLTHLTTKYQLIHQTGDAQEFRDYDRLIEKKQMLSEKEQARYLPYRFIKPDEMAGIIKQADLVISRAGMSTVLELLYFKKPSLLIPLPHGQKNEQRENALFLKRAGLARVKNQGDLTPERLYTEIEEMMAELPRYTISEDVPVIESRDAAEKIITTLFSVTEKLRSRS